MVAAAVFLCARAQRAPLDPCLIDPGLQEILGEANEPVPS